jgi:hypothetical protein
MKIEDLNSVYSIIHGKVEAESLCLKVCGSYAVYLSSDFLRQNLEGDKLQSDSSNIPYFFLDNYSVPRDIDFISLISNKTKIEKLFLGLDFKKDQRFDTIPGIKRSIFSNDKLKIDVFYDGFDFNHFIDLTLTKSKYLNGNSGFDMKRIDTLDSIIPLTELLLQKLQIVNPGKKDFVDAFWILYENEITRESIKNSEEKIILLSLINYYASKHWGFYKTITQNLNDLRKLINSLDDGKNISIGIVLEKIDSITFSIEKTPKNIFWKTRSILGTNSKWYNEVDEI